MKKKTLGAALMAAGLVYVIAMLALFPGERDYAALGFALIGFGCVLGVNPRRKSPPPPAPKRPASGVAGKKRR